MKIYYLVVFLFLFGCKDNLTINQLVFNNGIKYKITIEGHVNKPGLFLVEKDTNSSQVIKLAGGYKKNAEKIKEYVFKSDENIFINSNRIKDKINLNQSSTNELMNIKGIGNKKALAIIEHRKKYGDFKSISEIKLIKGIKDGLFNKIYEYLYI